MIACESFEEVCGLANDLCIKCQTSEKEIITDNDALIACAYIEYMSLIDAGDILLYCSALNLLNTYVKQPNHKVSYRFKNEIVRLAAALSVRDIDGVQVDLQKDGHNSLLVIEIYGIQFSFHNVPWCPDIRKLNELNCHTPLTWDKVRKQMCAASLFAFVRNNKIRYSNLTFRGKNLDNRVLALVEKYEENKIGFELFDPMPV